MSSPALKHGMGKSAIACLSRNLKRADPSFSCNAFEKRASRGLSKLELKERVSHVAGALAAQYPDLQNGLTLLSKVAPIWEPGDEADPLRGFAAWPLFTYVEMYGLADFGRSMGVLEQLTHLFSSEFAVRPFISEDAERAFEFFERWAQSESDQVRRLASEGIRPRLPWAQKIPHLITSPDPVLRILESLRDDESAYVRRSVGNNLNDIAKDHPELVIKVCKRWSKSATANRRWIIERATRSLVKQGHPDVWPLLGFSPKPQVRIDTLKLSKKTLKLGEELVLSFLLQCTGSKKERLTVDYRIHYASARGQPREKVFKLKVLELGKAESVRLSKKISFKPITTRKYYPGQHQLELIVNGQCMGKTTFEVLA